MSHCQQISVSNFKSHCLEYIEHTHLEGKEYILTKRNKPIAKLVPLEKKPLRFGCLHGTATIKKDIISPINAEWESAE